MRVKNRFLAVLTPLLFSVMVLPSLGDAGAIVPSSGAPSPGSAGPAVPAQNPASAVAPGGVSPLSPSPAIARHDPVRYDTVQPLTESQKKRARLNVGAASQAELDAVVQAQTSGMIGFETLALLNADLAHNAGALAVVTNDGLATNNGVYRKVGASGAGSWVASSDDSSSRLGALELRSTMLSETLAETAIEAVKPKAGTALSTGLTRFMGKPIQRDGKLTRLECYGGTAGQMRVILATKAGNDFTAVAEEIITVAVGQNSIALDLDAQEGQYVGFYFEVGSIHLVSGVAGQSLWWDGGHLQGTATFAEAATSQIQARFIMRHPAPMKPYLVARSATDISYFRPTGNAYIEHVYQRDTDLVTKHYDVWEMKEVYLCNALRVRTFPYSLTKNPSRWEHAIQVTGDADFSGGSIHGWEQIQAVSFLKDGAEWMPTAGEWELETLEVYQSTNLYRWKANAGDSEDLLAEVSTLTTFSRDGLKLDSYLDWKMNVTLEYGYLAMLPCERVESGVQVTAKGVTNGAPYGIEDISASGHPQKEFRNATRAVAFGGALGVSMSVEQLVRPAQFGNTFFSASTAYNKIYTHAAKNLAVTSSISSYLKASHLIDIRYTE